MKNEQTEQRLEQIEQRLVCRVITESIRRKKRV